MEIIQEFDNWRRVRDSDGSEGWINQSLLSGKRTAIAAPWQKGKDSADQPAGRSRTTNGVDGRHPGTGRGRHDPRPAMASGAR
jgi:SH3-like domain-containing protein